MDVEREGARPCSKSPLLWCYHYHDDYDDDDLNTVMIMVVIGMIVMISMISNPVAHNNDEKVGTMAINW